MMSDHSKNCHSEMYEFKETEPTSSSTSKECERGEDLLKGSALVDATDSVPVNNTYAALNSANNFNYIDGTLPCINDKVPLAENEDLPNNVSVSSDDPQDSSRLNDESRQPDDSFRSQTDDKENENEEDMCLKCLYVSMQCCECTIM